MLFDADAPRACSDTLLWGTPYRARRRIGRGGMGEVVLADHVALDKSVVVKLLHVDLNARPHIVERMRVEAQALARLAHENLVAVTDFGRTAEGRTYLVMERLHGRTLREELAARGRLPPADAIDRVAQALAGLSAAHAAGLVHRDVKLDNLFLCDPGPDGRRLVKVLDFGIAKIVAPEIGRAPAPSQYQTEEGVLVGTPRYLSPEQAAGRLVDARADIYAAGLVLYALLAGRDPFAHVVPLIDLLRAHAHQIPKPPSRYAPCVPPDLDRAVLRALEKDPDRRFPTAAAFAAELRRIAAELPPAALVDPAGPWTSGSPDPLRTTEPLTVTPVAGEADTVPCTAHTEPLALPPFPPLRLAATVRDVLQASPPHHLPRPLAHALVAVLVAAALVLGFALAFLLGL